MLQFISQKSDRNYKFLAILNNLYNIKLKYLKFKMKYF